MTIKRLILPFLLIFLLTLIPAAQVAAGGPEHGNTVQGQGLAGPQAASSTESLTNEDVIKLVKGGLPDVVIISKIKASTCRFDTGTDALLKLKAEGVSDAVIQAMVEARAAKPGAVTAPTGTQPVAAADPNDPMSAHDPGIYWLSKQEKRLMQLEPTAYSQGKTGGVFTSGITFGLKKAKWKAVVRSPHAILRMTEAQPEFWFYFEEKSHSLSYSGTFFGGASSPNEFVLAKMDSKKEQRELVVGEWGALGASAGTRSEDTVAIHFEKVGPGVYKVVPLKPLEPGEYCFFYAGTSTGMGTTGGKLFDFGVDRKAKPLS